MSLPFFLAALVSALWAGVHLFVGGREVARPLRAAALPHLVSQTAYLCWHFVSITLALMALLFLAAGMGWGAGLGLAATALAFGFALTGLVLPPLLGAPYGRLPQGWLFVPVVALGAWGLV